MKILMVCLGNICRSPLAEGIMRKMIQKNNLPWEVDSAGTSAWHIGEPPDSRSVLVSHKYGIDISHQQARQFTVKDFADFDVILAMDRSNYQDILSLASTQEEEQKVKLMLDYGNATREGVPDPYWDDDGFEMVYHLLTDACGALVDKLVQTAPHYPGD